MNNFIFIVVATLVLCSNAQNPRFADLPGYARRLMDDMDVLHTQDNAERWASFENVAEYFLDLLGVIKEQCSKSLISVKCHRRLWRMIVRIRKFIVDVLDCRLNNETGSHRQSCVSRVATKRRVCRVRRICMGIIEAGRRTKEDKILSVLQVLIGKCRDIECIRSKEAVVRKKEIAINIARSKRRAKIRDVFNGSKCPIPKMFEEPRGLATGIVVANMECTAKRLWRWKTRFLLCGNSDKKCHDHLSALLIQNCGKTLLPNACKSWRNNARHCRTQWCRNRMNKLTSALCAGGVSLISSDAAAGGDKCDFWNWKNSFMHCDRAGASDCQDKYLKLIQGNCVGNAEYNKHCLNWRSAVSDCTEDGCKDFFGRRLRMCQEGTKFFVTSTTGQYGATPRPRDAVVSSQCLMYGINCTMFIIVVVLLSVCVFCLFVVLIILCVYIKNQPKRSARSERKQREVEVDLN